ncbi:response regulator [bacterium]|nr:response regulator [bacterium]
MAKKILVVDNEPEFLKALSVSLKASGYEVLTAQNGQEGLKKAHTSNPDLIILDILMPRMDGYELCRLLKFDQRYKAIPIIMLTAKAQETDKVMGEKVGADGYITKPFETQDLLNRIKKFL